MGILGFTSKRDKLWSLQLLRLFRDVEYLELHLAEALVPTDRSLSLRVSVKGAQNAATHGMRDGHDLNII